MKIAITGASGFIGKELVKSLSAQGDEIITVARKRQNPNNQVKKAIIWNANHDEPSSLAMGLAGTDALIHLAGEPIAAKRWSPKRKSEIEHSRVAGTRSVVAAIKALPIESRPKTFISASAIGIYGDRANEVLTENSTTGNDFLANVTAKWEAEAMIAHDLGLRVVCLRTGIVLGKDGGALTKMKPVILGTGAQWMSWIHLKDVIEFIEFAIHNQKISGPYNLTAPHPVQNFEFTKELAKHCFTPFNLKVPQSILRLTLGEMSSLLLSSCRAIPQRALESGYEFKFKNIADALADIF